MRNFFARIFFAPSNKVSPVGQGNLGNNYQVGDQSTQMSADDADNLLFIKAAIEGDIANVIRLLSDERVKIDSTNEFGATALMLASLKGHSEIVEQLIKAKADVDLAKKDGGTALMAASERGHSEIVEQLIKANADVDLATKAGVTALMVASQMGHSEVVEKLISANADVDLATEARVNVDLATEARITALMLASDRGHFVVVEKLINANADVDLAREDGKTALMVASQIGHSKVVEQLINANANVDLVLKEDEKTALILACEHSHHGIVKQLIDARAKLDMATKSGLTPIFVACEKNKIECVEVLLKAGTDPKCLMEDDGKKINSKLEGVSEKMKELIEAIIKKENIKERDKALAATAELITSPRAPRAEALEQQTQDIQRTQVR